MESGCTTNDEACPRLIDLIPREKKEWNLKRKDEASSEEKKLELRLGPPGEENWSSIKNDVGATKNNRERNDESLLSLGYFSSSSSSSMNNNGKQQTHKFPSPEDHVPVPVGSVLSAPWTKNHQHQQQQTKSSPFLQFPSTIPQSLPSVTAKESSQPCCTKAVDLQQQTAEKKTFSSPANTAVPPCISQKRYSSFLYLSLLN